MSEIFIATESDGSQWVKLEDYNKLLTYKDELRGSLYSLINILDYFREASFVRRYALRIERCRESLEWKEQYGD
jgi:hypothetical protein